MNQINGLKARGWNGQFQEQIKTAKAWLDSLADKTTLCGRAMTTYQAAAALVGDSYEQFAADAEPKFMQAMQTCEAGL